MNRRKSQRMQILDYLQEGNAITAIDALNIFGAFRLATRIHELRQLGHKIKTELVTVPSGATIARYTLESDDEVA